MSTISKLKEDLELAPYLRKNKSKDLRQCLTKIRVSSLKGTDQAVTFMSLKCVVYYAKYRSWHQSSKIQVVS